MNMKRFKKYLPLIPAALVLGAMMFPSGCANTTTPPSGGPKDTIPPVLVKTAPLPGTINVPTHNTQLKFTFNEYVTVKDANNIFLSLVMGANMRRLNLSADNGLFEGYIDLYVNSKDVLEKILKKLTTIEGIESVSRIDL